MSDMHDRYENPLCKRYASKRMQQLFSEDTKFSTWRKLWIALAESEKELGLDITDEQIDEMKAHIYDIDYATAEAREKEVRHDVMAHIYTYGICCPKAKPIIHLGATSCFVGDNTDVIIQRDALRLIRKELLQVIKNLCYFADTYKALPTLAYTHYQAAQPTTLGKRASLWLQDLVMDLDNIDHVIANMKLLGCKGTTGTSASFQELFNGDQAKVKKLDKLIAEKFGFDSTYDVTGQTYTRKADYFILSALSGIAQSAQKFATDIRLLSHMKEVDEPFEAGQVGSSAMAYKRNPMRSERICSLSRFVITNALNPAETASSQWFERTLDDSANRRIVIPESFLATDGILSLYANIIKGLTVYPNVIKKHLMEELPFMATENILMYCVKKGGDRQVLHEAIRKHSVACGKAIKEEGIENDLLDRIANDPVFKITRKEIDTIIAEGGFTGMAEEQTADYLIKASKILEDNAEDLADEIDNPINV